MKYPSDLLHKADDILSNRKQLARAELDQRKDYIRENHPEIQQLRKQAWEYGVLMGKVMVVGGGNIEQHDDYHQKMVECNSRIRELLIDSDLPENYLEPWHTCSLCCDTGFAESGGFCSCRIQLLNRLAYEMLSNISQVDECTFDNFSLDYYEGPTVRQMEKLLISCRRYAEGFSHSSPNLLFMGPPGLGKTHLSLAIAREVVNSGRLVMYASAGRMLERMVDSAFGDESSDEYRGLIYKCDLLLVDDLGTEFKTAPSKAEVYSLVNNRLTEGRPTIINTNLTMKELEKAYDQRVASRLIGSYSINPFSGKDIRFQKRRRKS